MLLQAQAKQQNDLGWKEVLENLSGQEKDSIPGSWVPGPSVDQSIIYCSVKEHKARKGSQILKQQLSEISSYIVILFFQYLLFNTEKAKHYIQKINQCPWALSFLLNSTVFYCVTTLLYFIIVCPSPSSASPVFLLVYY